MEHLVSALTDVLRQPLASPFTPEIIVMQSKGMQRWLAMELASSLGVWANCTYPFPNAIVWQLFTTVFSSIPDVSHFSPELLVWKILGLLPDFLLTEPFASLRRYLVDDKDGLKRYQLALRIADTFDQYTLFRPNLLESWGSVNIPSEPNELWQSILWNRLNLDCEGEHRAVLLDRYCQTLSSGKISSSIFPQRISLFGISYLPPYHLQILDATASMTDVHLYLLSPSSEYWGDLLGRRELAKLRKSNRDQLCDYEGNALLASWGTLGREFVDEILDLQNVQENDADLYNEPPRDNLLHCLQADILTLHTSGPSKKNEISHHDSSLVLASCHSPLREVEVLYDRLLHILDHDLSIEPRNILVMTPDIELYAPYITTVFGGVLQHNLRIPYSIADRFIVNQGTVAPLLQNLLQLQGSRLTSVQLFDLLSSELLKKRFDIDDNELDNIRKWLEETAIRWGMDERTRYDLGLPSYRENSWRAGLERLLLGYAMCEHDNNLFESILPFDNMEGNNPLTLAKLLDFIDAIETIKSSLASPRTLSAWCDELRAILHKMIVNDENSCDELNIINELFSQLQVLENDSGYTEPVSLSVMRSWLSKELQNCQQNIGFLAGGVTFCAMLPMRSIPFKVIALLGLSDGAFPRQSRTSSFDLIAKNRLPGDRSLRNEDRFLFLEALLSARNSLYISFVGQSMADGSDIPPSVMVSELLDAIDRSYKFTNSLSAQERLVVKHRLQPFSRYYFTGKSDLFSYSTENLAAVNKSLLSKNFMTQPLTPPPDEMRELTLVQLLRFFSNPAAYFLQNRLGIKLQELQKSLEEREPFDSEGLRDYFLKSELLEAILAKQTPDNMYACLKAQGLLPPASHGALVFEKRYLELVPFAEKIQQLQNKQIQLNPLDIDLELQNFRITGCLQQIYSNNMFIYRYASLKGKDLISAWIEHLFLNVKSKKDYPTETVLIMKDSIQKFTAVDNATEILTSLLQLYWQGLSSPLSYFPKAAYSYSYKGKWDLEKARRDWKSSYNDLLSEADEPAFKLCFGTCDPIDQCFATLTRTIYEPLLVHLQEVKL